MPLSPCLAVSWALSVPANTGRPGASVPGQLTGASAPLPTDVKFDAVSGDYYPIIYFNDYWNLQKDYYPINESLASLPLRVSFCPLSLWRWQLYAAQSTKSPWNFLGDELYEQSDEEQDSVKVRVAVVPAPHHTFQEAQGTWHPVPWASFVPCPPSLLSQCVPKSLPCSHCTCGWLLWGLCSSLQLLPPPFPVSLPVVQPQGRSAECDSKGLGQGLRGCLQHSALPGQSRAHQRLPASPGGPSGDQPLSAGTHHHRLHRAQCLRVPGLQER